MRLLSPAEQKGRISILATRNTNVIIAPTASCPGVPGLTKFSRRVIRNFHDMVVMVVGTGVLLVVVMRRG